VTCVTDASLASCNDVRSDPAFDRSIAESLRQCGGCGISRWRNPEDVKSSYPKASILKAGRVVFNIKGNDYRLVARVQY
jgi:hypothetical protein